MVFVEINKKKTELLVDSGASVTVVSSKFIESLPEIVEIRAPSLGAPVQLETAVDHERINVVGVTTLTMTFGEREYQWEAYVAPIREPGLLGYDFLHHFDCIVDARRGLQIGGVHVPCEVRGLGSPAVRIVLKDVTNVPANSEMILKGCIEGGTVSSEFGLLEPVVPKDGLEGIMVARTLVDHKREDMDIPIRVMNVTNEPVCLRSGVCVGLLHGVETSDLFPLCDSSCEKRFQVRSMKRTCDSIEWSEGVRELFRNSSGLLDDVQQERFRQLLDKYHSVFATSPTDLGITSVIQHEIDTGDARPIRQAPRRPPKAFEHEEEQAIREQLAAGVLRESKSPWASPVVFVRKKDGSARPCVDYRKLNDVTRKDAYPLPRIDDCLDSMSGANLFSTIDLQSGYWQIEVKESDRPKTAVVTRYGLYEYQTMPFGLCNAPSTFQRCMELVLRGMQWKILLVYLDDIIVFSSDFEQHVSNLEEVLERLSEAGLKLKPSKCEFFRKEVSFLGHVVTAAGIKTDPRKVEAVQEWAVPNTVTELRSFLGFCSYYRKFIRNFADIAGPLHRLLEAGRTFAWDSDCQKAFEKLKSRLAGDTVMAYPNDTDMFILDTDASDRAIGSALSQLQWNEEKQCREERPIAYASKSLSKTQRRYCTTRRELLAVVAFVNHFRHFLLGRKFLIRTDHSALRWLMSFKEPSDQTARWIEILSQFNFVIEHRAGKKHGNADALSRPPCDPDECACFDEVTVVTDLPCGGCEKCLKKHQSWSQFAKIDDIVPLSIREIGLANERNLNEQGMKGTGNLVFLHPARKTWRAFSAIFSFITALCWHTIRYFKQMLRGIGSSKDAQGSRIKGRLEHPLGGGLSFVRQIAHSVRRAKCKHGRATEAKDGTLNGNHGNHVDCTDDDTETNVDADAMLGVWPRSVVGKTQAADNDVGKLLQWMSKSKTRPTRDEIRVDSLSPTVRHMWLLWDQLFLKNNVLYKRWERLGKNNYFNQLIVPKKMQDSVLRIAHDSISSAHLGVNKTLEKIKRNYYWYGMKDDVKNWIRKCKKCGARKRPGKLPRAPLQTYNVGAPLDRVATDILGPFPVSKQGNKYILVVGDVFTRWIEAYPIPDQSAAVVAHRLVYDFFARFGLPLTLHSDQGRNFESNLIKEVCKLLEIRKTRSSPYHPASNGMIERFNQTLVNMIASYVDQRQEEWDVHLPLLTAAYRSCEHQATGYSPNYLMLGHENHTPLSLLLGTREDWEEENWESYGEYAYKLKGNLSLVYDIVRQNLEKASNKQKRDYDTKIAFTNYKPGDLVYCRDDTKLKGLSPKLKVNKWSGPYVVTKKFSDLLFELKKNNKTKAKILHHDRLKLYQSEQVPDDVIRLRDGVVRETEDDELETSPKRTTGDRPGQSSSSPRRSPRLRSKDSN